MGGVVDGGEGMGGGERGEESEVGSSREGPLKRTRRPRLRSLRSTSGGGGSVRGVGRCDPLPREGQPPRLRHDKREVT